MIAIVKYLPSAAACLALLASRADACKCMGEPALQDGDLIFEGRPSEKSETTTEIEGFAIPAWAFAFDVTRVWKGAVGSRISIITPKSAGSCGLHYKLAETYVLSATVIGDMAVTNRCSNVAASNVERTRALAHLGEPKARFAATGPTISPGWRVAILGFFVGCIAASLWTAVVHRRRRLIRR